MTYREAAPREPLPIERFPLASTNSWLWLMMIVVMTVCMLLGFTSRVHLECVRPAAGEPARCTGGSFNVFVYASSELTPFSLEPDSIRLGRTPPNRRNYTYTAIVTNGGLLSGAAIDAPIARQTVDDAERFREDPKALEWRMERTAWKPFVISFLIGSALFAFWFFYRRWDVLVLDPNLRQVKIRLKTWSFDDIEDASALSLRGDSTLKLFKGVEQYDIAWGKRKSIEAAAKAIKRAIAERA